MVGLEKYLSVLLTLSKDKFGKRLLYIGLQGSYLRNEADENSDIDVMVVIDDMTVYDLTITKIFLYLLDILRNHVDLSVGNRKWQTGIRLKFASSYTQQKIYTENLLT